MRLALLFAVTALLSSCAAPPVDPAVTLSEDELAVGGKTLGLLKDVARPDYLNVVALEAELRERLRTAPTVNPCGAIVAPASTRYGVLKRVLFSCTAVGLGPVGVRPSATAPVTVVGSRDPFKPRPVEGVLTVGALVLHSTEHPRFEGLKAERGASWAPSLGSALSAAAGHDVHPFPVGLSVDDAVALSELLEVVGQVRAAGLSVDLGPSAN